MPIAGRRVTVATTATRFDVLGASPASGMLITNRSVQSVDIGGASVTTGAGYELLPGATVAVDLNWGDATGIYGIVAATTSRCDVLQGGA